MEKAVFIFILALYLGNDLSGQSQKDSNRKAQLKSIEYSNPELLAPPVFNAPGYPDRDSNIDALPGFWNPPAGYGEVPFWWWSGDPLDKDRLLWQIEELHKKGITGMQINYIH